MQCPEESAMSALATDRGSSSRLAQINMICLASECQGLYICERMLESPGLYTETYIYRQQKMKIQTLTIIKCIHASRFVLRVLLSVYVCLCVQAWTLTS